MHYSKKGTGAASKTPLATIVCTSLKLIQWLISLLCIFIHRQMGHQRFFLPTLHQSARGLMGHRDSNSQDSHWMNEYPIFLIMTSSLFSDSIHYSLCLVPFTNSHSRWKQYWPLTTSAVDWFVGHPGGQRRHKKTDDSIFIITMARFNLLSIQSAFSLWSQSVFFKNSKHLYAWADCHI